MSLEIMKKIFFSWVFVSIIFVPYLVLAVPNIGLNTAKDVAVKSGYDNADQYTLSTTIGSYIKVALSLSGTIFLALIVYAGFLWMTASGNEEQVTKATDIVKMAVIGLVITLAAFSITTFVISRIGGASQGTGPSAGGTGAGGTGAGGGSGDCGWGCGFMKTFDNNPAGNPPK